MPVKPSCLCGTCTTCYKRNWARERYRQKAYGTWDPKGDLDAVVAHLRMLNRYGMGSRLLAELGGSQHREVQRILAGQKSWMRKETCDRFLSITLDDAARVPVFRASRRLRALNALGYTTRDLAEMVKLTQAAVWDIQSQKERKWVTPETFERIDQVYRNYWDKPGNNALSIASARSKGYVPPMGWDDIDDESETPRPMRDDYVGIADPVIVERILRGEQAEASRAEKVAVVAEWRAQGKPVNELARQTGWKVERYYEPKSRSRSTNCDTTEAA